MRSRSRGWVFKVAALTAAVLALPVVAQRGAGAAATVTCTASSSTPTSYSVNVVGGVGADQLVITTTASAITVTFDASQACAPMAPPAGSAGGTSSSAGTTVSVSESPAVVATTFRPDAMNSYSFTSFTAPPGPANVLDLSAESPSAFSSLSVATGSSSCGGGIQLASSGTTIMDCFSNVSVIIGAAGVPTLFEPSPASASTTTFVGNDPAPGNSAVSLARLSPSVSDLTIAQNGDSASQPGTIVSGAPSSVIAKFQGVNEVIGSSAGSTTFQPGTSPTSIDFVGEGSSNTISYASAVGASGVTITMSGGPPVAACSGAVTGTVTTVLGSGDVADAFCDVQNVDGPSGASTDFRPGTASGVTFRGGTGATNTLDLSGETAADFNAFTVTLSGAGGAGAGCAGSGRLSGTGSVSIQDCFSNVSNFDGPTSGSTTFVSDGYGGHTFEGSGTSMNTLSYADAPTGVTVASPGTAGCSGHSACVTGLRPGVGVSTTDSVSGFTTFVGSSAGGNTFAAAAPNGLNFVGSGTGNTLDLPVAPAVTVLVHRDSIADPGTVVTPGGGTSSIDSFSDIQSFKGAPSIISEVASLPRALPSMVVGQRIDQQLTGSGGVAPYGDVYLENGRFPPGIVLSATGRLIGTPTQAGTYRFVIGLWDATDLPGATTYALTVTASRQVRDVVGIASASPSGYWLVTSTGGVYPFGSARHFGSCSTGACAGVRNVVGMASDGTGGYWLVTATGIVYPYGDAHSYGSCSTGGCAGAHDVVGIASAGPKGYWIATGAGAVYPFGSARHLGTCSTGGCAGSHDVVGIATTGSNGYWLATASHGIVIFSNRKSP